MFIVPIIHILVNKTWVMDKFITSAVTVSVYYLNFLEVKNGVDVKH